MIIHSNLSIRWKTKFSQSVYKEAIETVQENSTIHHVVCLGLRGLTQRYVQAVAKSVLTLEDVRKSKTL